jgi:hypothetical protein
MQRATNSFSLSQLSFSAKIDYVRIATPGKCELPELCGRPVWGVAAHYKELTIHDLQQSDVPRLARVFPNAAVLGLEVAVDAKAAREVSDEMRPQLLYGTFLAVARHLYPYDAPRMADAKTAAYVPTRRGLVPFARRTPGADEELLYGFRDDQPVQVKCYLKRRDNGADLATYRHCVRVEVAFKEEMCAEFGIHTLEDLIEFRFRKLVSSYFRMVHGAKAQRKRSANAVLNLVATRLADLRQTDAEEAWSANGVQQARQLKQLRYLRASGLNQKIGKALQHLQDRFAGKRLVGRELITLLPAAVLEGLSRACIAGRVTTKGRATLQFGLGLSGAPSANIQV